MTIPATPGRRSFAFRHPAVVALAVAALLGFAGIFQHGLWAPDEPREAEIGREMLASNWSAVPTLGGTPFLEKPPLFLWIMAAAFKAFGVSPGVARLPGALFGIGAAWIAYLMGRRAGGRLAGVAAAVALVTMSEFAAWSHRSVNDTALTFFVAAGHFAFLVARDEHRLGRRSVALVAAGSCAGFAFLTKGFIGPVLLAGPPILAAAALREWSFLRFALPRAALWCTLFVVAIGLPWVVALADTAGWGAVTTCLWKNTIGRSLGGSTEEVGFLTHTEPVWFYLRGLPEGLGLWTLALPAVAAGATLRGPWRGGRSRYLAILVLTGVVLLSIPAGKRALYIVPLLPAAAAVLGTWLSRVGSRRGGRFDRATVTGMLALLAAAGFAAAYACAGGPIPRGSNQRRLAEFLDYHRAIVPWIAAACGVAGALIAWLAVRGRRRPSAGAARSAAVVAAAAWFLAHAVGRPLLDRPLNDMEGGATELAAAVPGDEEMLAVAPDETTRAVVPFYTGRKLRVVAFGSRAPSDLRVPGPLGTTPWRYLVVMESSEKSVDAQTRRHLRLERTVRLTPDREVRVYRYEPD